MSQQQTATPDIARENELLLWPQGAPLAKGKEAIDVPLLTVHLPKPEIATGTGVIVNPGGGYRTLASDHEGLQVARWLNRMGIAAFVLRYRLGKRYDSEVSLLDGKRAMRLVRFKAREFGVSTDRIGMLGFSAGGHLAIAVGTQYDDGDPLSEDPVDQIKDRPDFLVPVYAVTNGEKRGKRADVYAAVDEKVTEKTPPTFLVHTHEDSIVSPEQSLLLYQALHAKGVQAEMHVFGYGDHGVGLAVGDPDVAQWPDLLMRWMRRTGLLSDAARVGVKGRVTLDGVPMGIYWVTFIPADKNAPIARTKTDSASKGNFEIEAYEGPVQGSHRVEVRHISNQYPYTATGAYTMHDATCYVLEANVVPGEFLNLAL